MSTSTKALDTGSVRTVRGGLTALLAAIVLAAAAMVALKIAEPAAGTAPVPVSDAEVQKALIDVRAGERAFRSQVGVPTAEFWAKFRAEEREMR